MLENQDFYPTPKKVIECMLSKISDYKERWILEPSAGKGDILDYIISPNRTAKHFDNISAIESSPELQAVLKEKGYKVIASDFLSFQPSNFYNLIVMNPPFSNGVDHILHAWNILHSGDIVCLLNAETLLNPFLEEEE